MIMAVLQAIIRKTTIAIMDYFIRQDLTNDKEEFNQTIIQFLIVSELQLINKVINNLIWVQLPIVIKMLVTKVEISFAGSEIAILMTIAINYEVINLILRTIAAGMIG